MYLMAKKPKLNISQFCNFYQIAVTKKFHTLNVTIFSFEILNNASQINLAVNYHLRFSNFDFGAVLAQLLLQFGKSCKLRYGQFFALSFLAITQPFFDQSD